MRRKDLEKKTIQFNNETREAILTILDALNQGQRKKVLKNEKVIAIAQRYGIVK